MTENIINITDIDADTVAEALENRRDEIAAAVSDAIEFDMGHSEYMGHISAGRARVELDGVSTLDARSLGADELANIYCHGHELDLLAGLDEHLTFAALTAEALDMFPGLSVEVAEESAAQVRADGFHDGTHLAALRPSVARILFGAVYDDFHGMLVRPESLAQYADSFDMFPDLSAELYNTPDRVAALHSDTGRFVKWVAVNMVDALDMTVYPGGFVRVLYTAGGPTVSLSFALSSDWADQPEWYDSASQWSTGPVTVLNASDLEHMREGVREYIEAGNAFRFAPYDADGLRMLKHWTAWNTPARVGNEIDAMTLDRVEELDDFMTDTDGYSEGRGLDPEFVAWAFVEESERFDIVNARREALDSVRVSYENGWTGEADALRVLEDARLFDLLPLDYGTDLAEAWEQEGCTCLGYELTAYIMEHADEIETEIEDIGADLYWGRTNGGRVILGGRTECECFTDDDGEFDEDAAEAALSRVEAALSAPCTGCDGDPCAC